MGNIQPQFLESLVKMDHFQKEPPLATFDDSLAVDRLQILDDVSNFIQTRMRDRLRLTTTRRFPTIIRLERLRAPIDRRWLASN
jgi:hypothetical protein